VVAVEARPERREPARRAGAVVPEDPSAAAGLAALGGEGADAVFVATSSAAAIATGLELAGPASVVQLFAPPKPGQPVPVDLGAVWFREVRIESTYSAGPFDTRDALELLARGAVDAEALVSHRVPLSEVQEAFRLARSGEALKVVVELA